jgi:hypothetical protein
MLRSDKRMASEQGLRKLGAALQTYSRLKGFFFLTRKGTISLRQFYKREPGFKTFQFG